jgi:hypothetical protein
VGDRRSSPQVFPEKALGDRHQSGRQLHDEASKDRTIAAIRAALESAGIEFTNGDAWGVRMRTIKMLKHQDFPFEAHDAQATDERRDGTYFHWPAPWGEVDSRLHPSRRD